MNPITITTPILLLQLDLLQAQAQAEEIMAEEMEEAEDLQVAEDKINNFKSPMF